jgi:hypothetical protein
VLQLELAGPGEELVAEALKLLVRLLEFGCAPNQVPLLLLE